MMEWRKRVADFMQPKSPAPAPRRSSPANFRRKSPTPQQAREAFLPSVATEPASMGSHPCLGVDITDGVRVGGKFQRYTDGVVVVNTKGAARAAGILPNDVLLNVDNTRVTSASDFQAVMRRLQPGQQISVHFVRDSKPVTVELQVQAAVRAPGDARYRQIVKIPTPAPDA
eukprot:NODE_8346_length_554_cov_1.604215_g8323_i0.p1 GENE.NODE_8346_length_554_cov_1.604215_g8323_i0~~NODE_8346_length_554_cov_1.604215_g8323_i0.p1  ORF type:complete len:171 (-),score=36.83 NODE_8346_length_554_cov_1.604215_g8323_i0:40-552(-)